MRRDDDVRGGDDVYARYLLFVVAPIMCVFVLDPYFVSWFLVSFLV